MWICSVFAIIFFSKGACREELIYEMGVNQYNKFLLFGKI